MKRIVAPAAVVILFATVTILSNSPLKGDDNDRDRDRREADEIQNRPREAAMRVVNPP